MNGDQVVIRAATLADLGAVAAIFGHYVTTSVVTFEETPPDLAHWRHVHSELAGRGLPFLVCADSNGVAGYAYAAPWRPKPAYRRTVEDSIYVAPGRTGRGLGRMLLDALLGSCAAAGAQQVIAVIADNGDPASAALHRACGFTEAGRLRQVGHKQGHSIDTLLFQGDLACRTPR